jgi:hypothetical protein
MVPFAAAASAMDAAAVCSRDSSSFTQSTAGRCATMLAVVAVFSMVDLQVTTAAVIAAQRSTAGHSRTQHHQ